MISKKPMAGKVMIPSKASFVGKNGLVYGIVDDMLLRMSVFGK